MSSYLYHLKMDKICFENMAFPLLQLFEVGFPPEKLAAFPSAKIRCLLWNGVCKNSFNLGTVC